MNGYKVLKGQLRCNGVRYNVGAIIEVNLLDENERENLVSKGIICSVVLKNEVVIDVVENTSPIVQQGEDEPIETTLDLNFTVSELKEGAKEQGLEFKGNISKPKVIQLIVEANKQGYFLEQLTEEGEEDEIL